MRDAKGRDATTRKDEDEESLSKRQSEATSGETLSDFEKDEKVSGPTGGQPNQVASPDGQLDETDEIAEAGPM